MDFSKAELFALEKDFFKEKMYTPIYIIFLYQLLVFLNADIPYVA